MADITAGELYDLEKAVEAIEEEMTDSYDDTDGSSEGEIGSAEVA